MSAWSLEYEAWAVPVIIAGLFLLAFLAVVLAHLFPSSQTSRLHRALCGMEPAVPSDALAGHAVKVVGRVALHQGRTLTAPFTGRQCVFYSVRVEHVTADVGALVSVCVAEDAASVPFLLVPQGAAAQQAVLVPSAAELGADNVEGALLLHTAPHGVSRGGWRRAKRSGIVDPLAAGSREFMRNAMGKSEAARLLKEGRVLLYTEIAIEEAHWLAAFGQLRPHTNAATCSTQCDGTATDLEQPPECPPVVSLPTAVPQWSLQPVPAAPCLCALMTGLQWGQGSLVSSALRAASGRVVISAEKALTGRPSGRDRSKRRADQCDSALPSPDPSRVALSRGGASPASLPAHNSPCGTGGSSRRMSGGAETAEEAGGETPRCVCVADVPLLSV